MADRLHIRLGGRPAAWRDDGSPVASPTRKALALLVPLARCGPAPAHRGILSDLLWPGRGEPSALAALRRTLHELRRALGADHAGIVRATRETPSLDPARFETDAGRIEAAAANADPARLAAEDIPADGSFPLETGIGSEAFDDRCAVERARLCDTAPRLDPADEAGRRALIRALSALGRRAEALRRYAAFRAHLAEDLGIGPDPRTAAPAEHVRRAGEALPDAPPPRPDQPSIAVPPFRDLTGAEGRRHPVDGPAGSIPDDLARDRALFVIAETSGRLHRDTSLGPREIAAELGIRHLPSGRARLDRRRLRLDVELVDAVRGAIVRPERHDRPRADMPSVQDEIAGRIVAALRGCKGIIRRNALQRARARPTADLDAHDPLMRGMALKERFLRADMLEARRHFDQAIAPSPQLAPAHGWLAWTWFFEACMGWAEDPAPAVRETFRAAREALRLDPDLDFAHRALGAARMAAGDMNRSLAAFERALELDPNNSDAMANRAWPPMFAGDPDAAVESVERAARLDPFHPDRHLRGLGMAESARDAPEASISAPSRMARPNRQSPAFLAAAHHRAGDDAAAAEAAAHPTNLDSGFTIEGVLGPLPFADPTVRDRLNAALKAVGPP